MFEAARRHLRSVAMIGAAAALTVGGVAMAQGGSDGEVRPAKRPMAAPVTGIGMGDLTYAELHVRDADGESETIRIDQGKVKSVDADAITITENDGNEVTVPVDDATDVIGKPGEDLMLDDLRPGQLVHVTAPEGEPAQAVMVLPKKADVVRAVHGHQMPPPPGLEPSFEMQPAG